MFVLLSYIAVMLLMFASISIWMAWRLFAQLGGEPTYASGIVKAISDGNLDQMILTDREDSLLGHMRVMQKKLKENMQLKNDFISTVSHELRTPLTSICGGLGLVVGKKLGDLPKPAMNLLEIAHRNALRLTDLINDLLDIDKITAWQIDFQFQVFSLNQLSQEMVETMGAYAEKCGVTLQLVPTLELDKVRVDARRVQQVMMNFISKAAKFSPSGAMVKINVSRLQDRLRFEVIDQGSGIPKQFHGRIFSRFAQVDSSDTKKVGGTGLGLAISKELINRMGGEIGFHSTTEGSVFFFEFNGANE